jgi:hypothetical protein
MRLRMSRLFSGIGVVFSSDLWLASVLGAQGDSLWQ